MNQAQELFTKLISMNTSEEFLNYCTQVLGAVERIHVDFKEKRDIRNPKLEDDDKKNLAKAVSGFANSGGGVLIWGIEDETLQPKSIVNVEKFAQNLLQLASQVTDPIVGNIDGKSIISNAATGEGFAMLLIPESTLPPHRIILNYEGLKNHYFVRSGNSFVVASHTMLEDMFGRRPKPDLKLNIRSESSHSSGAVQYYRLILGIENNGRGSAKSPYLAVKVNRPYKISQYGVDGNGHFGLTRLFSSSSVQEQKYGSSETVVIHPGISHDVTAIDVEIDMRNIPSYPDVAIDYRIVAEGLQVMDGQRILAVGEIIGSTNY